MKNIKAIPDGYMTVGEIAKKSGVTVRAMQYYDKQGLLSPSAQSAGRRRLYTDRDIVLLHQILSLKHLGFSLNDIKNQLVSTETPEDVANALTAQATEIRKKIDSLAECLRDIEALKTEVLQMQLVDFKKYADIIVNLQMKNEFYWLIKHFDNNTLEHLRYRFDKESAVAIIDSFSRLQNDAISLKAKGILPNSEQGIAYAEEFWSMITEFTGGDMSLLPKLMELGTATAPDSEHAKKQALANAFTEPALSAYFETINYNPLEET